MNRTVPAAALAAIAGFAVWTFIALSSAGEPDGHLIVREAWDVPAYWSVGVPLLAAAAAIAGFLSPVRVWRWALWAVAGHAAGMAVAHPAGTDLGLLPLSLVFVGLPMAGGLTIAAAAGAVLARRGWDRGILA